MLRRLLQAALICACAALTSGCWVFGFGFVRAVPVGVTRLPPSAAATPVLPVLRLQSGGQAVDGLRTDFHWQSGNFVGGGGANLTAAPLSPLQIALGDSLDILVRHPSPPAALWAAELDSSGTLLQAAALRPTSTVAAYTPVSSGSFQLRVTAEWSAGADVTYIFLIQSAP